MNPRKLDKFSKILIAFIIVLTIISIGLLVAFINRDRCSCDVRLEESANVLTSKKSSHDSGKKSEQSGWPPWAAYRLPGHIKPISYSLLLNPNFKLDSFTGTVDITVNVSSFTDYFIVHSKQLTISDSQVRNANGLLLNLKQSFEYSENEFWVVTLPQNVTAGIYNLFFRFNGSLTNGIVGFYKSEYDDGNGTKQPLATSKFEPTYARRAYPCFDEPNFRASFNVTLIHPSDYFALSNMPKKDTTFNDDDSLTTTFYSSVSMPTYLTCFIICDFKFTSTTTSDGKLFRVYSSPEQVNFTENALQIGSQIQDFYTSYYDIPYPLPKQDMIAIPDFVSGAMEHWGLITFRETNLLYKPNESSLADERRVASVIGHELAHMWFGNLVTMMWWDDLWLNEGFASYVEYLGVASVKKNWQEEDMIIVLDVQPVMILDASPYSHPIIQPVGHPDEITEIFDSISYSKGSSVLRMLDHFMGSEDFRAGLHNYLKRYSFGNARTVDLWRELEQASTKKLPISTIMDTWTKQMGFPVISIRQNSQNPKEFTARQERFLFISEDTDNNNNGYLWEVPITYRDPDGSVQTQWMHKKIEKTFLIHWADTHRFIKFNVDQTGFYKVNYDLEGWQRIIQLLKENHKVFSSADRAHILDDVFTLSMGGYANYSSALSLSTYLVLEEDYLPWKAIIGSLNSISKLLKGSKAHGQFIKKYIFPLCTPLYIKLGWGDTGDRLTRQLRPLILDILCLHGHAECLREAHLKLLSWMDGKPLSPNLRGLVYCHGLKNSVGTKEWDFMWKKYSETISQQEKSKLLSGLACVRQPNLLYEFLEYVQDPLKIRSQDVFSILNSISKNPIGTSIIWYFVREKWEYLVKRFTINDRYLGKLIPQITNSFTKHIQLQEMLDFFKKYPDAGAGTRARVQAIYQVRVNINWLESYEKDIEMWLKYPKF